MSTRWVRRFGAATFVVILLGGSGGLTAAGVLATAAPGDGGLLSRSPTLALQTLTGADGLAFHGLQSVQTLAIPVLQGLRPTELRAVVERPVALRFGVVTVVQDNRVVSRVPLPDADRAPIVVPLGGAVVRDNAVTVDLRMTLVPIDGACIDDPGDPLRFAAAEVAYDGDELPPTTVADFLPPVLQGLTIFVPADPTPAESDAAVRLTAAVTARYGAQHPDIAVAELPAAAPVPEPPAPPLTRRIVIREDAPAGIALQPAPGVPDLVFGGPANELQNQVRLVASDVSRLAISSKAVVGPLATTAQLPPDVTTIRRLGQPGVNATAVANPRVTINLDQARLGRSAKDLRIRLQGSYTPLPANLNGQVVITVGDETVARWPAEPSGAIDRWVDVPNGLLQRYTAVNVALNAAGNTGGCGASQPLTLTIDGESTVSSVRAQPPVVTGFQSLPQALMPRLEIGIGAGGDALPDTVRAAAIVEGLQRLSALPLDTAVVPLPTAIDSPNPAVLISAGSWTSDAVPLPVSSPDEGAVSITGMGDDGGPVALTLDPQVRFGSLQTVLDGNRTVLVATSNGAPDQLDSLLNWLDDEPRRWSRLTGDALLGPAGVQPLTFDTTAEPVTAADDGDAPRTLLIAACIAAGLVVVVAVGVVTLRRRRVPK
ncbi:hypothetical protein LV457_06085 [Mycobacterium sp. MYCO198283]|uniref:hypothetical protein n=1 Tax=Mycobacterium sp. MYCO198283 TaxID=2883505 RepID=UPI001E5F27DD|nr:hypothetical protein [Mycobacterium sp. MYCO198283]MCG5431861.1 hypothetical protein [Mycobacterium sp. MYCO198283]